MKPISNEVRGLLWGLAAVVLFGITLPATRIAVISFDVSFVILSRAIGAAVLAAIVLVSTRSALPARTDILRLCGVASGVVFGFPGLTAIGMQTVSASHGAVIFALLPLSTAIASVLTSRERPRPLFWIASVAGTAIVVAFVLSNGLGSFRIGDLALFAAVLSAAFGYAVGGHLAMRMKGWQVISWALVMSLPMLLPIALAFVHLPSGTAPVEAWISLIYVMAVSQFLGLIAWYRGLSLGGVAKVSQLLLLQLFVTLAASAVMLDERIDARLLIYACLTAVCVAIGTRSRVGRALS